MLRIIKAHETIEIKTLVACIYGEPGAGKTSLAFSASRPILLDADSGAHRSANRQDIVQVASWADCAALAAAAAEIADYDTVVVDTVGRVLDFLAAEITKDQKLRNSSGGLSQQGFGALKSRFGAWLRQLRILGKDVVLIAHVKEEKNGEVLRVRPEIAGSSYNEILKSADLIGYLSSNDGKRTVNFKAAETRVGKDPVGYGAGTIPNLKDRPRFFAEFLKDVKAELGRVSSEHAATGDTLAAFRAKVDAAVTASELEELRAQLGELPAGAEKPAKTHLWGKAKSLGIGFEDGKFVEQAA